MKSDQIQVVAYPHPLKAEKIILKIERCSIREIYAQINSPFAIENAIIIDGDERVTDFDIIPKSNYICIKFVPEGLSLEGSATATKIAGAALTVAGIFTLGIPGVGVALLSSGIGLILGGISLHWLAGQLPSDGLKPEQGASIKGSSNQENKGGPVPILIGRHLIYPFVACSPYTTDVFANNHTNNPSEPDTQAIYQLFCAGYKDMNIETDTYKIGDTNIATLGSISSQVQVYQNGEDPALYGRRRYEVNVSKELTTTNATDSDTVTVTSPTNCDAMVLHFVAMGGIADYDEDDDIDPLTVYPRVQVQDANNENVITTLSFSHRVQTRYTHRWYETVDLAALGSIPTNRQYILKIYRRDEVDKQSDHRDNFHIGSITFTTADFSSGSANYRPINATYQADMTIIATRFVTSGVVQDTVQQFNFIAQTSTNVYSGSGSGSAQWTTVSATSNPSALFLYVLRNTRVNKRPTADTQIDWPTFENWYTFCNTKEFEANFYVTNDVKISELLNRIAMLGRASWNMVDGKYTIIVDEPRTNVIQYFTPRNSRDFEAEKAFSDVPTCLKVQYISPSIGYTPTEQYVYSDERANEFPGPNDIVQEFDISGAATDQQVTRLGKYILAQNELQPEVYKFTTDLEYIFCTRGDRIRINHDVPLLGLGNGRIESINVSGVNITGFVSDESLRFEFGKDYSVLIRRANGDGDEVEITNPTTSTDTPIDTTDVLFVTPVANSQQYLANDLFMFGERGEETLDLLVNEINPTSDLSATLMCVEYNPDIYTADSGAIPTYDPLISLPGDDSMGLSVGPIVDQTDYVNTIDESINTLIRNGRRMASSLVAKRPTAYAVTDASGYRPRFIDGETFIYINLDDGNTLYKKTIGDSGNGTKIGSVPADFPVVLNDGRIAYVNQNQSSKIYVKNNDDALEGTEVTTVRSWALATDSMDNIYYINYDDMDTIYKTTVGGGNGTKLLDDAALDLAHPREEELFYIKASDSKVYKKNDTDTSVGTLVFDGPATLIDDYSPTEYIYLDGRTGILNSNLIEPANTSDTGTGIYAEVSTFDALSQSVLYSYTYNNIDGFIFYGARDDEIANPELFFIPELDNFIITGSINSGSRFITNVSAAHLALVSKGDIVSGTGVPTGTIIHVLGPDYIFLNQALTATNASASLTVSGSRLYLDANKVIASGSIEARHIETSAISSKATDSNGNKISAYDLDTGTRVTRKADGTIVEDFDPNRAGTELIFAGNISENALGSDGSAVPTGADLVQIGTVVRGQEDGSITITESDTAPTNPDEGDLWLNTTTVPDSLNAYHSNAWISATNAEQTAYEIAKANGSLLDKTAKIFAPSPNPTDYAENDIWIRYTNLYLFRKANTTSTAYDASHWDQVSGTIYVTKSVVDIINAQTDHYITYNERGSEPSSPSTNDIWEDTSVTGSEFKIYNGTAWVLTSIIWDTTFLIADNESTPNGAKIFSSEVTPFNYKIGDLWLEAREQTTTAQYRSTTASETFDEGHWVESETAPIPQGRIATDAISSLSKTSETIPTPRYELNLQTGRRVVKKSDGTVMIDENPEKGEFTFKGDITGATGRFDQFLGETIFHRYEPSNPISNYNLDLDLSGLFSGLPNETIARVAIVYFMAKGQDDEGDYHARTGIYFYADEYSYHVSNNGSSRITIDTGAPYDKIRFRYHGSGWVRVRTHRYTAVASAIRLNEFYF